MTSLITQQIIDGVEEPKGQHVEFYSESLDLFSFSGGPSAGDIQAWLAKKYGGNRLDAVVAIGPDIVRFLKEHEEGIFKNVPIVICGSMQDQAGNPALDSHFTGTWQKREAAKTVEAALQVIPRAEHLFVVAGSSSFDRFIVADTKQVLAPFESRVDVKYLTNLPMKQVLQQVANLPAHSILLYLSFFEDVDGNKFVNATKALPIISDASTAPVFGMSDTYLGHGIVGGAIMSFQEQGKVTAKIVSQILAGTRPEDIPIQTLPSQYTFDWRELRRWKIEESKLPQGTIVLFREPSIWARTKWIWITTLFIIAALSALTLYLQRSRRQLQQAEERQRQLSGMLINAGEKERSRVANELHDDFSQRLAVMALKLENVSELVAPLSPVAEKQLHDLLNSTSELSADLHSLSHRLHSSTLQSLGLDPALSALCKEFSTREGVKADFASEGIPRSIRSDVALCAFRIVQEGLRNIKKHSGASVAKVRIRKNEGKLLVTVQDNGRGFDSRNMLDNEGLGLRAMKERASLLGGEFRISSAVGKGTLIEADIPLDSQVFPETDTST